MKSIMNETLACAAVLFYTASPVSHADVQRAPDGGSFPLPELVTVPSEGLFAPPWFDDNDNVQVVAHGELANTCYKIFLPKISVDRAARLITITPRAFHYSSPRCLDIRVPFTQRIDLGLLPEGHYRVAEYDGQSRLIHEALLFVSTSLSSAPDDFLYAPVRNVRLDLTQGAPAVILSGTFPSCMEMQEVKVQHRAEHVLEVLPVAAYKAGADCRSGSRPFEARVSLPSIEPGNTLIHVRALSGASFDEVELF